MKDWNSIDEVKHLEDLEFTVEIQITPVLQPAEENLPGHPTKPFFSPTIYTENAFKRTHVQ